MMRDGITVIKIPRKGGKLRTEREDVQWGRDNAAKSLRFERKMKRKHKEAV